MPEGAYYAHDANVPADSFLCLLRVLCLGSYNSTFQLIGSNVARP